MKLKKLLSINLYAYEHMLILLKEYVKQHNKEHGQLQSTFSDCSNS